MSNITYLKYLYWDSIWELLTTLPKDLKKLFQPEMKDILVEQFFC